MIMCVEPLKVAVHPVMPTISILQRCFRGFFGSAGLFTTNQCTDDMSVDRQRQEKQQKKNNNGNRNENEREEILEHVDFSGMCGRCNDCVPTGHLEEVDDAVVFRLQVNLRVAKTKKKSQRTKSKAYLNQSIECAVYCYGYEPVEHHWSARA